jgi:hypothetical protein
VVADLPSVGGMALAVSEVTLALTSDGVFFLGNHHRCRVVFLWITLNLLPLRFRERDNRLVRFVHSIRITLFVSREYLSCLCVSERPAKRNLSLTFSGARALRKSQTMMIGDESSSDAVTSLVAYISLKRIYISKS